ncbi:MAG: DUF2723 domain-containing protein [Chloroflexi bacterium]|nr:DUF2723 domain-containing protein [Chloroflexota bacterium]
MSLLGAEGATAGLFLHRVLVESNRLPPELNDRSIAALIALACALVLVLGAVAGERSPFRRHPNRLPTGEGTGRPHPSPLPGGEGDPSPSPAGRGARGEGRTRLADLFPSPDTGLPLFLLWLHLLPRDFDPRRATLVGIAAFALVAGLAIGQRGLGDEVRRALGATLVVGVALAMYLATLAPSVAVADGYELQVVSDSLGVAHPTGYPLYTLVGKLFTLLPVGEVAYRVNLFSAISAALGVLFVYLTVQSLTGSTAASTGGALALAFSLTYWRQAVIAEKYALDAAFVAVMLYLLASPARRPKAPGPGWRLIAFVYGLSLTHHRTMLLLLPALGIVWLGWLKTVRLARNSALVVVAFALPLGLYAYIPLRRPMALAEFLQHVTGAEYAGAFRWASWMEEPERAALVARFVSDQFGPVGLALAAAGAVTLVARQPIFALAAMAGTLAQLLFAASYYADYNDANYLLPVSVTLAIFIGLGLSQALVVCRRALTAALPPRISPLRAPGLATLIVIALPLHLATAHYVAADRSEFRDHVVWAQRALETVEPDATILAHGARFAALDYLAHTVGQRHDARIVTYPTEGEYLARIDRDLATGHPVYTARRIFADGRYRSESAGLLTRLRSAASAPGDAATDGATGRRGDTANPLLVAPPPRRPVNPGLGGFAPLRERPAPLARWGSLELLAASLPDTVASDEAAVVVELHWRAREPLEQNLRFRPRLHDARGTVWAAEEDGVPVDGNYPTPRWPAGAVVRDTHRLALPPGLPPGPYDVRLGVHLDFHQEWLAPDDGRPDLTLGRIVVAPRRDGLPKTATAMHVTYSRPDRPGWLVLRGADVAANAVEAGSVVVNLWWQSQGAAGGQADSVVRLIGPDGAVLAEEARSPLFAAHPLDGWSTDAIYQETRRLDVPVGSPTPVRVEVAVREGAGWLAARPTWLSSLREALTLAYLGVEPAHPQRDDDITLPVNFGDQLALRDVRLGPGPTRPGDYLTVILDWQALRRPAHDYVVSVQATADRPGMLFQQDRGPAVGAFPTTWWRSGEAVVDRHRIAIPWDVSPGEYRLQISVYRPDDLSRLPILDEHLGTIGDVFVAGLIEVQSRR